MEELLNSTIDPKTYPEPYPFTSDSNIFDQISYDINPTPFDQFVASRSKDIIRLNIQRYVDRPMDNDEIDLPSLQLSYSI